MPGGSRTGPGGCCATRAPAAWPCGQTRPSSISGRCHRASSSAHSSTSSSTAPAVRRTTPTSWTPSSRWPSKLPADRRLAARTSTPGWIPAGSRLPTRPAVSTTSCSSPGPPPGRYPTWRCGSGPCSGGSGPAWTAQPAQILLAVDEFSAVARRLPIWQLYERARSLGLAVQVSAQSWHGLAPEEDERYRIATAAEGGIWLLRTAHPEPVTGLAGVRRTVDSSRTLLGFLRWSRQGNSRVRDGPVADPAIIRALDVGQAAYIYRGGVTYTQIKRLVSGPAALAAAPRAAPPPAAEVEAVPAALADISSFLDEAFGT